jgi:dTDP-4-amino-4,6-dideoxygalactose transaminase
MFSFLKERIWYTPAETKIPWFAIGSAFLKKSGSFSVKLCNYMNIENCILAESARVLLFKLLEVLNLHHGSKRNEILVPGYTCYSVAAAVAKANLKISVYDLDPKTLQPDLVSLEKIISEKTLAIIVQHLFGKLTPMDEIKRIAQRRSVYLIEDAAQAFGKIDNVIPGSLGDFGLLSFGRGKPLPVGGGGALVSHHYSDIFNKIQLDSKEKGRKQVALFALTQIVSRPAFYWIFETLPFGLGKTVFNPDFQVKGMSDALEKVLVNAFSFLDRLDSHRKFIASIYKRNVKSAHMILINDKNTAASPRFPVLAKNGNLPLELQRLGVRRLYPNALNREAKIIPFITNHYESLNGAKTLARELVSLPTHHLIDDTKAEKIAYKLNQWIDS